MGRSGYTDDMDDQLALGRWRGRVASAARGKRGQAFFQKLIDALDAMPEKLLINGSHDYDYVLEDSEGGVCALGALGNLVEGKSMRDMDPEDYDGLGDLFDIASCLVQETEWMNDEGVHCTSDEERWKAMRKWAGSQLCPAGAADGRGER